MGVRSTHFIKRQTAIEAITKLAGCLSNDELGDVLFNFPQSQYRNYIVLDEFPEGNDWPKRIETLEQFEDELNY